jgi:cell division septal protein FtsQ
LQQLSAYITSWDYFDIKHIDVQGEKLSTKEAARYCDIDLPQNILTINIDLLALKVRRLHPDLKGAIIRRQLPDTLIVKIIRREPIAQIQYDDGYFLSDSENYIIRSINSKKADLPVIIGLRSWEINDRENGICKSEKLSKAIDLIDLYRRFDIAQEYGLRLIDVNDRRNYILLLDDDLEIRLGKDNFESKLKNLSLVMSQNTIPSNSYIDLRFKDITTAPR